jgi:hypothetical protein
MKRALAVFFSLALLSVNVFAATVVASGLPRPTKAPTGKRM